MNKKLSVIIPYYKTLELTEKLIDVLLPQIKRDDVEVILVDDGCYDDELKKYIHSKDLHETTFIMNQKLNGGVSSARNKGLEISEGRYIAFIDSDDLVREDYIEKVLKTIDTGLPYYKMSWESFGVSTDYHYAENLPDWNCAVWCRVFRRDIIKEMFREDMKACEDKQFLVDNGIVYDHGLWIEDTGNYECGYIEEPIYKYNSGREGSLSNLYL